MSNIRTYKLSEVISFTKVNDYYGHFSNMAGKYKIIIDKIIINSSEAFYQSLKYPSNPDIQSQIISENSPLIAKRISYKYLQYARKDWEKIKINVMRLSLRLKLLYNLNFKLLLINTNNKPIVEISRKDNFWGTIQISHDTLVGANILGRLLMELREEIYNKSYFKSTTNLLLKIPDLKICNTSIIYPISQYIINHDDYNDSNAEKSTSYLSA